MSQQTVAAIIGRAAVNKEFLNTLKTNPEKIISENKNDLTPEEIKSLKTLNHAELDKLHQSTIGTHLAAFIDKGV
jgi:formate dehydrogenase assembly factor FdhD